jgi:hypothetical protein
MDKMDGKYQSVCWVGKAIADREPGCPSSPIHGTHCKYKIQKQTHPGLCYQAKKEIFCRFHRGRTLPAQSREQEGEKGMEEER